MMLMLIDRGRPIEEKKGGYEEGKEESSNKKSHHCKCEDPTPTHSKQ